MTLTFVSLEACQLEACEYPLASLCNDIVPKRKRRVSRSPTSYSHGARWGRGHVARRHSRLPAKRGRQVPVYLYRRQSDFRRCKRLYMARCKGGLFDTTRPIMRRYIRRASIVNTTSFSLSLPSMCSITQTFLFSLSLSPSTPLSLFFLFI